MIPGTTELLIIFAVLVLLFGANKLPKLGGAIGQSIRNFRSGLKGDEASALADSAETRHADGQDKVTDKKA